MSLAPQDDPDYLASVPKQTSNPGFSVVGCLLALLILGVLTALSLPVRRSAREAARRAQCTNSLKQIALALQAYREDQGVFPPATLVDTDGRPLHSWRTLILPYLLEEETLYRSIDLTKPWHDPANAKSLRTVVNAYRCPASGSASNTTNYLAIVGEDSFLNPTEPRAPSDISDAESSTLMVIEAGEQKAI